MIDRLIEAFDLKANSSCGVNSKSIVNFSLFLTVPNSLEILRKGKELLVFMAKSKLKSPLFSIISFLSLTSFTKMLPKLISHF
jgi:hypothetical protein